MSRQALNALLQIQQGMEQLRTAAPSLVTNLGLGVGAAAATPPAPAAPAAPPRAPNTELFTQVGALYYTLPYPALTLTHTRLRRHVTYLQ
jgi:hypothetical protein